MPSSFHAIFPPPQTLESTGEWGDLDSLLWSLDDPRWLTIGVYGIRGGETARTIQGATFSKRVLPVSGSAYAQATETEGPRRVRLLVAPAYAVSGVSCLRLLRIRCACGESSAHTLEVAMPSIKGHNWNDEVQGMRDWERLPDTVQTGETQGRGAAIWNAVDDGAADWAPISEAHKTNWRGIVQWP